MPDQVLHKIMAATEPADVAQMAMIECVRQMADNGKQTNKLLEGMQAELRDVRERVIRIEATEFKAELTQAKREIERLRDTASAERDALKGRIEKLELKDSERTGGWKFADALAKYGPILATLVGFVFIILVASKRIIL